METGSWNLCNHMILKIHQRHKPIITAETQSSQRFFSAFSVSPR